MTTKPEPYSTRYEDVRERIASVEYDTSKTLGGVMCVITMRNGWSETGFCPNVLRPPLDIEECKAKAYEAAFDRIWQHEKYLAKALASTR